jgi:acyl-homoserine-lactone acylase
MKTSKSGMCAFCALVFLALYVSVPAGTAPQAADDIARKYDVRILRDIWGVPHVIGKKDTDTAFGLAYAHAQDDFKTIQIVLVAISGHLAEVLGPKGAGNDFLVHLIRLWDTVNARYDTDLTPGTRALCEAYADGINYYAALHPDEAMKGFYPVNGKHIVAGFVHKMPLMVGVDIVLKSLFEKQQQTAMGPADSVLRTSFRSDVFSALGLKVGSNALAVSPKRTPDGKTLLAVNSHQPWDGPVSWYEAHVQSAEGWNMVGGLFPGSPVVFHGHNEYLGWAHTNNFPDLVDVYTLEMNPENPNQYRYDGAWKDLEVRKAPIKVRLLGFLPWTFNQEVLWSVYGPTIRRPHGVFAIRYAGLGDIRQVEQWYRMNRARTIEQWESAVSMGTLPMFNCTYADGKGNILYVYQALLPLRDESYDWAKILPGNTSRTLWTKYLPYDRLPMVKNPSSGFIMNCNNTPFSTTLDPENPLKENYSPAFGIETRMTNRAYRALELFGADRSITEEEFYTYKYDMAYSKDSKMAALVKRIISVVTTGDPLMREALGILSLWDLRTDPENTGTALGVMSYMMVFGDSWKLRLDEVTDEQVRNGFSKAVLLLREKHGRLDVPWKQVNRLIRGKTDLGMGGGPDILHAMQGDIQKDGRIRGNTGDSYVLLVAWDKNGKVHSRSIHVYGSATLDGNSPHYADQSPLFARRELKPVWMAEVDIRAHLEAEYRPGMEARSGR